MNCERGGKAGREREEGQKRERSTRFSLVITRRERKYLNGSGSQAGDQIQKEPAFSFFSELPHRGPSTRPDVEKTRS